MHHVRAPRESVFIRTANTMGVLSFAVSTPECWFHIRGLLILSNTKSPVLATCLLIYVPISLPLVDELLIEVVKRKLEIGVHDLCLDRHGVVACHM